MPSTYTSNLRLEKQATGENRSTWGIKANNVFEMIEDAISGWVDVSMSDANYSLTVVNGNEDQARQMIINVTGAHTAVRTLTIPASDKLYFIRNATTGGFSVTVSNGTNTVDIENGQIGILVTDGTTLTNVIPTSFSPSITFQNATTNFTAAAGQIAFDDTSALGDGLGGKRISWDDGNFDFGMQSNVDTSPADDYAITGDGAAQIFMNTDSSDGTVTIRAAVMGTAGDPISWGPPLVVGATDATFDGESLVAFPSGTAMVFAQTAAPTGWTKSVTHDNKALRLVSGTVSSGGTVAFTTAFTAARTVSGTVAGHTLTTAQMPSHTHAVSGTTGNASNTHTHSFSDTSNTTTNGNHSHTYERSGGSGSGGGNNTGLFSSNTSTAGNHNHSVTISGTTGGQSANHTHSFSDTSSSSGSGNSHDHGWSGSVNLDVQYVDVIIATKD